MSSLQRGLLAWCAGAVMAVSLAFGQGTAEPTRIQGFRVPLYDDNGTLTSQIFGDYATMMPDGMVEITELLMEFYDKDEAASSDREPQMRVTSPLCFFHRERQMAASESSVRISGDNMVVTGKGFLWNNEDQKLIILTNSKVILKNVERTMDEGEDK